LSQIPDEKKKNPKKNNKDSEQSISNSNIYKQILGFSGLFFFLIIVQPSTSVALSFAVVVFAILMLKNAKFVFGKGFLIFSAIFVLTATIALNGFPHIRERLTKGGDNYQSQQAITAIGSGGIFGLGLGKSEAKFNRLPEIENDYIFSLIAEETGITGSLFFMIIYILFITQGFFTAMNSQDNFGKLAAFGFTVNYAFAFLAHLFVNLGFISTGASLPFVSYGGTAMIADTISLGILLNISSSRYEKYERIRI
jgi:cell division protein FtsW